MSMTCHHSRPYVFLFLLVLGLLIGPASTADAQVSCWVPGSFSLNFGQVTPTGKDANGSVPYTCQNGSSQPVYVRFCLSIDIGPLGPGPTTARRMINYSANTYLGYDLYSDPARTQRLGPATSGDPVYTWTVTIPGNNTQLAGNAPVYGRVPSGQSPAAGTYQEQGQNGLIRYRYRTGSPPPLANGCQSGGPDGGFMSVSSSGVLATFANACNIITATDLAFGQVSALTAPYNQTSTIQLQCPNGTVWRVGLDNGSNAAGNTRRMAGPGGFVTYELYRDSARTQRWGNTVGTDTSSGTGTNGTQALTVYGRVPAQASPGAGAYSDIIRVTLTF
jgi:spore coat protein U-like protein